MTMNSIRSCLERGWFLLLEKGSSLAQSWGQHFLSIAGVGLGDCTAAQENIWAPSAWCHPFGWMWTSQELCSWLCLSCSHYLWDQGAAQQLWAGLGGGTGGVPLFHVAALIPGPWWYLGTPSLCVCHQAGWRMGTPIPPLLTGTTGPVCSKLGHLVLPQVTSSEKSFLQGWRSLSPYYALTGIWLCLLEMDVGSWTRCNKGRTFFWLFL